MMENIRQYGKTILLFLCFLRVITLLFPEKAYEKYVRPIGMLFLVLLLIRPVVALKTDLPFVTEQARQQLSQTLFHTLGTGIQEEGSQEAAVLEEYQGELLKQLSSLLLQEGYETEDAAFSISREEQNYGAIEGLRVVVVRQAEKITREERVRRVLVETGTVSRNRTWGERTAEELFLQEKLADFYCISREQIAVTVRRE